MLFFVVVVVVVVVFFLFFLFFFGGGGWRGGYQLSYTKKFKYNKLHVKCCVVSDVYISVKGNQNQLCFLMTVVLKHARNTNKRRLYKVVSNAVRRDPLYICSNVPVFRALPLIMYLYGMKERSRT